MNSGWKAEYNAGKLSKLLLVILIVSSITAACQAFQTTLTPITISPEPTDFPADFPTPDAGILAECLSEGGRWEILGFSGPGCNLPTSDGGKACRDFRECESACLGDPNLVMIESQFGNPVPDHDRVDELNKNNEENTGFCSAWQDNFGCQVWVENGRYVVICVD